MVGSHGAYLNGCRNASPAFSPGTGNTSTLEAPLSATTIWVWPESRSHSSETGISDAELITLAVMQALLGHTSEARWLRYTRTHLHHLFRYLPQQPGYNKRLRRLGPTIGWLVGVLALDTTLWTDDVWVVDSTPVECARSREAAARSDLAGWAEYGYCASHSRFFWSGGCGCICCARCTGCPSGSP
jgi:hypothetical protein